MNLNSVLHKLTIILIKMCPKTVECSSPQRHHYTKKIKLLKFNNVSNIKNTKHKQKQNRLGNDSRRRFITFESIQKLSKTKWKLGYKYKITENIHKIRKHKTNSFKSQKLETH